MNCNIPYTDIDPASQELQDQLREQYQLPEQAVKISVWLPHAKPVLTQFGVVIKRQDGLLTYTLHGREIKVVLPGSNV